MLILGFLGLSVVKLVEYATDRQTDRQTDIGCHFIMPHPDERRGIITEQFCSAVKCVIRQEQTNFFRVESVPLSCLQRMTDLSKRCGSSLMNL